MGPRVVIHVRPHARSVEVAGALVVGCRAHGVTQLTVTPEATAHAAEVAFVWGVTQPELIGQYRALRTPIVMVMDDPDDPDHLAIGWADRSADPHVMRLYTCDEIADGLAWEQLLDDREI